MSLRVDLRLPALVVILHMQTLKFTGASKPVKHLLCASCKERLQTSANGLEGADAPRAASNLSAESLMRMGNTF